MNSDIVHNLVFAPGQGCMSSLSNTRNLLKIGSKESMANERLTAPKIEYETLF